MLCDKHEITLAGISGMLFILFLFCFVCNLQDRPTVSGVKKGGKDELLLTFLIASVGRIYRLHKIGNSDVLIITLISKQSTN